MKYRGGTHSRCTRGKRVRIMMRNGDAIIGKFMASGSTWIELDNSGRLTKKDIRAFIIVRGLEHRQTARAG